MHFLALTTALAAAVSALPAHNAPHARHEKRGATPASWVKRSIVPDKALLPVRIGLSQSNLDRGHDMLMDISRHDSPNYGKHLTQEEVHDLFAPAEDTIAAISLWLREAGIEKFKQSVNKQWMQLDLTAEELGSLLKTEYHEWEHVDSGDMHVACDE
jgi:tripeptidyl-peptidase-1